MAPAQVPAQASAVQAASAALRGPATGTPPPRQRSALHSVFARTAMIFALAMAVIVGTLSLMNALSASHQMQEALSQRVRIIGDLLSGEVGGGLQFDRAEPVEAALQSLLDEAGTEISGISVQRADGTVLAQAGRGAGPLLMEVSEASRARRAPSASENGLAYARPVFYGDDQAFVGTVALGADPARMLAQIRTEQMRALAFALVLFLCALGGLAFMFRRMISRPLTALNGATESMAGGMLDLAVPGTARRDEIGEIACQLEALRMALAGARDGAVDAAFKSAAFEGSSAALMMCDAQMNVLYMNSALREMMRLHADEIRARVPSFDPLSLIGRNMDEFHAGKMDARRILSDPRNLPYRTPLRFANSTLEIMIGAVSDAEGKPQGFVVEWKDVTQSLRSEAVMAAVDSGLARAEFTPDGRLQTCNTLFAGMAGETSQALRGADFATRLVTPEGRRVIDLLSRGETVQGRLRLLSGRAGGEQIASLDGSFGTMRERGGGIRSFVLIARDRTSADAERAAAESERERMVSSQLAVVDAIRKGLEDLAGGDLTSRLETPFASEYEELRNHFNEAIDRLRGAFQGVIDNAAAIRNETGEISAAADDLSRRTEQQAATLEETAAALDQLTSSVRSAAEVANTANGMVEQAKTNAERSGAVVREAVIAMSEIEESSDKIGKITGVIDEIAFQTNLLALNAGVEAARAGEAGRGFAVVASEVRALAQRSSDAAREIAELITASSQQVKRGVGLVGEAGQALEGIEHSVTEIYGCVSDIAVSAREQSSGLGEINTAVNQLDQVTQQNAAMFEETTAASHSLNREAEALTQTMLRFRTGTTQQGSAARSTARPAAGRRPVSPPSAAASPGDIARPRPETRRATPPPAAATRAAAPLPARSGAATAALRKEPEADDWEDF